MLQRLTRIGTVTVLLVTATGFDGGGPERSSDQSGDCIADPAEWKLSVTPNFRIHYLAIDSRLARDAAVAVELERTRIVREWICDELPNWQVKCDIYIHRSSRSFVAATGRRSLDPGYSTVTLRRRRPVSRRIDLLNDGSDLIHAVLPHEISHIVFASELGDFTPPLWVDEGIAVLSEKADMKLAHQKRLDQLFERGRWLSAEQLMTMKNYPDEDLRDLFYAESVSLVEFLVRHRGAREFIEFVRTASSKEYESELRRVYGFTNFKQLEDSWAQHVHAAIASRKTEPPGNPPNAIIDAAAMTSIAIRTVESN